MLDLQKKAEEAKKAAPADTGSDVAPDRFMKGGQAGGFGVGAMGSTTAGLNAAGAAAVAKKERKEVLEKKPAAKGPTPPPKPITSSQPKKDADSGNEMRGYKTLADGRKTSFFHMEVSEEAKRLQAEQGSFVHGKKIDATEAEKFEAKVTNGASVWNSSGTPEEKDMTKWAEERLQSLLLQVPA